MNATTIVIIAFFATAIIVAIAMGIWLFTKNRRTKELRSKFGPEYNRMARSEGDAARAEHLLQERQKRVKKLDITPLTERQRHDFADKWEHAQARFVDDPAEAVAGADVLVKEVMNIRGYPVADFEQRVAVVSFDNPSVVQIHLLAHDTAVLLEREGVDIETR